MTSDLTRAHSSAMICRILGNTLTDRIICAIGRDQKRPIELSNELRASASAIVNQLKILKTAGLVRFHSTGERRKGRIVRYWLADPNVLRLCELSRTVVERVRSAL